MLSQTCLSWISCRSFILIELDFGNTGFCGERKTVKLGEKASEQGEPTTDPTAYDTGPESKSGHMMNVVPRSTMNTNDGTEN